MLSNRRSTGVSVGDFTSALLLQPLPTTMSSIEVVTSNMRAVVDSDANLHQQRHQRNAVHVNAAAIKAIL